MQLVKVDLAHEKIYNLDYSCFKQSEEVSLWSIPWNVGKGEYEHRK